MPLALFASLGAALSAALAAPAPRHDPAPPGREILVVALKGENAVGVIDAGSGETLFRHPLPESPHEVALAPDGRTAVVGVYGAGMPGSMITIVDIPAAVSGESRAARTVSLGSFVRPHGLAFLPDGTLLVTAEQQQSLLVIDLDKTLAQLGLVVEAMPLVLSTGQPVSHMVVADAERRRAYTSNIAGASVSSIPLDEPRGSTPDIVPHKPKALRHAISGPGAEGIALSPDGAELWVANNQAGTISVFDAEKLERIAHFPCGGYPIRVRFTPDGKRVLVPTAFMGELAVFDAGSRELLARIPLDDPAREVRESPALGRAPVPIGIDLSPDGAFAYVSCQGGDYVAVVDLAKLELRRTLPTGREPDGIALARLPATQG